MSSFALRTIGKAASERLLGFGPGRARALFAAVATGTATAALTYRVLRSGASDN
jgi:hypothetical protein